MDIIIVLDHFFNFTKKSYLTGRLLIRFNTIFDDLAVVYFFGPPCKLTLHVGLTFTFIRGGGYY